MYNLSILIPTVPFREKYLKRLLTQLKKQIKDNGLEDKIEILIDIDNLERSVGEKRNDLTDKSKGKYVVYFDDDDYICDDYCEQINDIIENYDVDQIGYNILIKRKQWYYKDSVVKIKKIYENTDITKVINIHNDIVRFFNFLIPTDDIFGKNYFFLYKDKKIETHNMFLKIFFCLVLMYKFIFGGYVTYEGTQQKIPIKRNICKKIKWGNKRNGIEDIEWRKKILKSGLIKSEFFYDKVMYYYDFNVNTSLFQSKHNNLDFNDMIEMVKKEKIKV